VTEATFYKHTWHKVSGSFSELVVAESCEDTIGFFLVFSESSPLVHDKDVGFNFVTSTFGGFSDTMVCYAKCHNTTKEFAMRKESTVVPRMPAYE
jgi:hypothetical protein